MIHVTGRTLPEAYHRALWALAFSNQRPYSFGCDSELVPCPDYKTKMLEAPISFTAEEADAEPFISRIYPGGPYELQQYIMEVRDGILDFMVGAAPNVWEYTYHQRIGDQLLFVMDELKRNPWSRRAVVDIRDKYEDQKTEHPACLQHMQFTIRDGKLHLFVLMRSNDAFNAAFMNAVAFITLQKEMAEELGVGVGSYAHTANSFHVYEKDLTRFSKAVAELEKRLDRDLTYKFKGFYDKLMADEVPAIMQMVAEQKKKIQPCDSTRTDAGPIRLSRKHRL